MRRLLLVGAAVVGGGLCARRCGRGRGFDFERLIERMPENPPPRWIFRNVSAIRENTERIRQLLEREPVDRTDRPARAAA